MFKNTHDAIFVHDLEGHIFITNGASVDLTGYSVEELHQMKIMDLLKEENWFIAGAIERFLLSGAEIGDTIEAKLLKKDKSFIYVHLFISSFTLGNNSSAFQCTMRDISEHKRMQENLQNYLLQATRAQEEERKRIARELHDETMQDLVVLSRQLDLLASKGKELSPENSLFLKDLRQNTQNIMSSLRNISQDLRPATLDRLGLFPALGHFASETTNRSGIAIKVNLIGSELPLPEETKLVLFRIGQEALNNIWRHSQANKAEVTLELRAQDQSNDHR
jgi:PAS domain S-box-containing protein